MPATTTLLDLVTPTQGTLPGVWGDTVNYGITEYLDIAIAGTLTLTTDSPVTLTNTIGSSSGTSIGATTAQYAIIKVTGTFSTTKIITAPSHSKTYLVVNASSAGTVSFIRSGQVTAVSIATNETALVYYNGTDYVKVVGTATAGAAGGATTQVQYNNAGVLAGITGATSNGTALTLVAPVLGAATATSLQGIIGNVTPAAGSFTTLGASSTATLNTLVSSGATLTGGTINGMTVGATTASTGAFTTLSAKGGNGDQLALDNTGQRFTQITIKNNGTTKANLWYDNTNLVAVLQAQSGSTAALMVDATQIATASSTGLAVTGTLSSTLGATIQGLTVGLGAGAQANNTAVGVSALAGNSTGTRVTAVGALAGIVNTASDNAFIGYNTGASNTSGTRNTALGSQALANNISGTDNTAVGYTALLISTGSNNTAVGGGPYPYATLSNNNSGAGNTAVGTSALAQNSSASNNTVVGYQAGYTNSTGDRNTFLGVLSGNLQTTSFNTFVGARSGLNSTGARNTFVGAVGIEPSVANYGCGELMTTGANNTILGGYSGNFGGLDIRTASNYIVLSDGEGNPRAYWNSANATFNGALALTGTLSGGTSGTAYSFSGSAPATSLTLASDGRLTIGTNLLGGECLSLNGNGDGGDGVSMVFKTVGVSKYRIGRTAAIIGGPTFGASNELCIQAVTGLGMNFFVNGSTQAAVLDSSGNLGIGVAAPLAVIDVLGTYFNGAQSRTNGGTKLFGFRVPHFLSATNPMNVIGGLSTTTVNYVYIGGSDSNIGGTAATDLFFYTAANNTTANGTLRMTIDSSGNLLVGTTTTSPGSGNTTTGNYLGAIGVASFSRASDASLTINTNTDSKVCRIYRSGSEVGDITVTTTTTSFNSTSDYRLKTVVGAVTGHGARIDALEPIEYTWNSTGLRTRGFLAHKFQEVYANSVTGTKDAMNADGKPEYQSMQASTSEVIADLVAELQSLRARVAQLESKP